MFKERFKELRELKKLTQSQLAKDLHIGRASVSNYELGTRTPDVDILIKIADYFGVSTDYLTGRSEFKSFKEELKHNNTIEKLGIKNDTLLVDKDDREKIISSINLLYNSLTEFFASNASENSISNSRLNGGDIMLGITNSLSSMINKCSTLYKFSAHTYEYENLINNLNILGMVSNNDTNESNSEISQINLKMDPKSLEGVRGSNEKLKEFITNSNIIQLTHVLLGLQNGIILNLSNIQKSYTPKTNITIT